MSGTDVIAFEVTAYTDEIAVGIGLLMPQLDPAFSGEPTPRHRLERTIDSPYHAQFVAEHPQAGIVGALSVSMLFEPGFDQKALTGGVVTRDDMRGRGIGRKLIEVMFEWARVNKVDEIKLETELSKPTQPIGFYLHLGAEQEEDSVVLKFKVPK